MKMNRETTEIIKLLQEGKNLPIKYRDLLFPEGKKPKEYELVYAGKEREEDVLADTMAVPLQPVKTFGQNGNSWTSKLIFGNNLQILKSLLDDPEIAGQVKLIYIDPPFGTGDEYSITDDLRAYSAKLQGSKFIEFLRKRLVLLSELLSVDGSIYIRIDYHFGHYIKAIADEVFGAQFFGNEIIINRFKRQLRGLKQFNVATDSLYFYSKSNNPLFNEQLRSRLCSFCGQSTDPQWLPMTSPGLRNPPERIILGKKMLPPRGRHWTFTQQRIDEMQKCNRIRIENASTWVDLNGDRQRGVPEYLQTEETPADSNWTDIKGYVRSARYPTENPEELLERVIKSSSSDDDIVLDAFAGSGTTLAVAEKLGRKWIGIDCGKLAIYTMQKRLLNISKSKDLENPKKKYNKPCKPFTLYNAGLYDYQSIKSLPWEQYRSFVLKLFQCRDEKHSVSGLEIDGYLGSNDVLVFDYQKHKDVILDRSYVDNLHNIIGEKIGERFFVIAPAASINFLEDYIQKGGTKYFFLRIPYSLIQEIHKKGFSSIKQPVSEFDVNDTVESVGFDFIQMPDVYCDYLLDQPKEKTLLNGDKESVIAIKSFKSRTLSKQPEDFENYETLSMVMLDYNYNDDVFNLERVFYAEELKANNYEVRFDANSLGKNLMIIYIDIFGNEKREIKTLTDFKEKKVAQVRKASISK